MTLFSMSSRSSVDRAPARCSGGPGFYSFRGLRFFFVPRSCHADQFSFHISFLSLKFTIFIHFSSCSYVLFNIAIILTHEILFLLEEFRGQQEGTCTS